MDKKMNVTEKFVNENNFDYEQYKKDIELLKEISDRVIKNNPLHGKFSRPLGMNYLEGPVSTELDTNNKSDKRDDMVKKLLSKFNNDKKEADFVNELYKYHNDVDGTNFGSPKQTLKKFKNKLTKEIVSVIGEDEDWVLLNNATYIKKQIFIDNFEEVIFEKVKYFGDDGRPVLMDKEFHDKIAKQKIEEKKKDSSFQKELDEILNVTKDKVNKNFVGEDIVNMIKDKSKEKINNLTNSHSKLPGILQELEKFNMYGVYSIVENRFNCVYLDFIEEDEVKTDVTKKENIEEKSKYGWSHPFLHGRSDEFESDKYQQPMKTISIQPISTNGILKTKYVDVLDKNMDQAIIDYINDEFIIKVKEMAEKNIGSPSNIKNDLDVKDFSRKEKYSKISNKINMVSNYIMMKNRIRCGDFIIASRKNIDTIIETFSGFYDKGKTYRFNKKLENLRHELIVNDDLGDEVIIGMKPKDNEIGIKLVLNQKSLNDYVFSDDDIKGINVSFDFFAFGKHPEYNYFSFNLIS